MSPNLFVTKLGNWEFSFFNHSLQKNWSLLEIFNHQIGSQYVFACHLEICFDHCLENFNLPMDDGSVSTIDLTIEKTYCCQKKTFGCYLKNVWSSFESFLVIARLLVTKWHDFKLSLIFPLAALCPFDIGWPRLTLFCGDVKYCYHPSGHVVSWWMVDIWMLWQP